MILLYALYTMRQLGILEMLYLWLIPIIGAAGDP